MGLHLWKHPQHFQRPELEHRSMSGETNQNIRKYGACGVLCSGTAQAQPTLQLTDSSGAQMGLHWGQLQQPCMPAHSLARQLLCGAAAAPAPATAGMVCCEPC